MSSVTIKIPFLSLVILCGPAGCGKSTFAHKFFLDTQIVSSDKCRAMIADEENNMAVSGQAFKLFYMLIDMRLSAGKLTVADSTALEKRSRKKLQKIAGKYGFHTTLIVFNVPFAYCLQQNASRERKVETAVIGNHVKKLEKTLRDIGNEEYHQVFVLDVNDARLATVRVMR